MTRRHSDDYPPPALLPPDPDRPGRYWLKSHEGEELIGKWNPVGHWKVDGWRTLAGPADLAWAGYTFASDPPRPIPSAAALERLYKLVREIHDRQPKHEMRLLRSLYGGKVELRRSMSASAYADAAAMLRAAVARVRGE